MLRNLTWMMLGAVLASSVTALIWLSEGAPMHRASAGWSMVLPTDR